MVEDAFPGWYEVLKGKRIQPVISESVAAANVRAEQRRQNNMNGSLISSERATTSTYATTTMSNSTKIEWHEWQGGQLCRFRSC